MIHYSEITAGIEVSVTPLPLLEKSEPLRRHFAFSYEVTLRNDTNKPFQLLDRHWIITSNFIHYGEVRGPGVVGLQPVLYPGDTFRYSSGVVIDAPEGTMAGEYTCRWIDDERRFFQIKIPLFDLRYPEAVH